MMRHFLVALGMFVSRNTCRSLCTTPSVIQFMFSSAFTAVLKGKKAIRCTRDLNLFKSKTLFSTWGSAMLTSSNSLTRKSA
uniref:Putative secreted protein n=1 Tax=Ixodes ricinus TaxID=34613 RepID=A0A6B0U6V7_IXORI